MLKQFLNSDFLFNPVPPTRSDYYLPLLIVFGVLILAGISIFIFGKGEYRKFLRGYATMALSSGTIGLIHLGARHEGLPWLASRIVLVLDVAMLIVWMTVLAVWLSRYIPKYQKEKTVEERYEKYLPKKKAK